MPSKRLPWNSQADRHEPAANFISNRQKRVVVDAGHGGKDPGAIGPSGITEKSVNLAIARNIAAELGGRGYVVTMTRSGDLYLSPTARAEYANRIRADFFLSIHANAHASSEARGTEVLFHPSGKMRPLALALARKIARIAGGTDRGAKPRGDLTVLRRTRMPAVLVEVAFISNPREEQLLAQPNFQAQVARGIAEVIDRYLRGDNL